MPAADPAERKLSASIAANTRWANEPDRSAATRAARTGFDQRFLDQVDPDRRLTAAERERRAANARTAHFQRMARASAQARAKKTRAAS